MLELLGTSVVLLLVGPLLVIGLGGLLLVLATLVPGTSRRVRETFRCPVTGRVVTADFVVREWAPHPSEVASCTAFPDPQLITCTRPCRELADTRWGLSRGVFPRWALIAGGLVTWRSGAESAQAK
jgi:hypothetical protein